MILVDTSIWIDHLHRSEPALAAALARGGVLVHPLVIQELALGSMADRASVLDALHDLPHARSASDEEVLTLIESRALHGRGLSAVDVHLLASHLVTEGSRLWTRDKRLRRACEEVGGRSADLDGEAGR